MKKKYLLAALIAGAALLTACGLSENKPVNPNIPAGSLKGKKVLVAYFSRTGHTKEAAEQIAKITGADTFAIRPLVDYPDGYIHTVIVARQEKNDHFLPPLSDNLSDVSKYDVIFLGYPIWWSDAPMVIHSFLKGTSFAGKTIIPFATSSMTGIEQSEATLKEIAPEAHFLPGFMVQNKSDLESLPAQLAAYGF